MKRVILIDKEYEESKHERYKKNQRNRTIVVTKQEVVKQVIRFTGKIR